VFIVQWSSAITHQCTTTAEAVSTQSEFITHTASTLSNVLARVSYTGQGGGGCTSLQLLLFYPSAFIFIYIHYSLQGRKTNIRYKIKYKSRVKMLLLLLLLLLLLN